MERDRGCLVPILVTPLSRASITVGKLLALILYVFFLLLISIPFAALSFGFGGTDFSLLLSAYTCIVSATLFFASIGLFVSTVFKRTIPAVILTYSIIAVILVGTVIGDGIRALFNSSESMLFIYLNPFFSLFALLDSHSFQDNSLKWWVSPAVQTFLSVMFLFLSNWKIKHMRE